MDQKIFHGDISPNDLADYLIANFNRGNLSVQKFGNETKVAIQIASSAWRKSGGSTAISVLIQKVEDGVAVQIGQQAWLGVAASLGYTALAALKNPFTLLGRLDDLAQDVEYIQLLDNIWNVLDAHTRVLGTGFELSDRLKRYVCEYCQVANPPGEPSCIACGAPLGKIQPTSCKKCGFILNTDERICPNCKARILK